MKDVWRKMQLPLMLTFVSMPPVLVLAAHALRDRLWLCALFAALYTLLAEVCLLIRGRARLLCGVGMSALLLAAGIWLMPWRTAWYSLALPAGYAVMLLAGLPMGGWEREQELPPNITFVGVGVYVVVQLMMMFSRDFYAPVSGALLCCFLAYGALWLLSLNRQSLNDAASHGNRAPQSMRRRNLMLNIGLMILVALIAAIPALARALEWLWERLMDVVAAIIRFLSSLFPESEVVGESGGGAAEMGLGVGEAEPSLLAQILEKVVMVLACAAGAVLLVWVLRMLARKLRVLFQKLWTLLNRFALAASEDYVDEVTDTRASDDQKTRGRRSLFGEWFQQVNEEKLTPVERVRYRYRRLVRRHAEWQPGSTARENLPSQTAVIYERARYSGELVTAEEAEAFATQARTLEKKG